MPEHTALRCVDVAAEQAGVKTYIYGDAEKRHGGVYFIADEVLNYAYWSRL